MCYKSPFFSHRLTNSNSHAYSIISLIVFAILQFGMEFCFKQFFLICILPVTFRFVSFCSLPRLFLYD